MHNFGPRRVSTNFKLLADLHQSRVEADYEMTKSRFYEVRFWIITKTWKGRRNAKRRSLFCFLNGVIQSCSRCL